MLAKVVYYSYPLPEEVKAFAASEDYQLASSYKAVLRQRESLSWRAIVRHEFSEPVKISYDSDGAPVLDNNIYIGVTHSRNGVAVAFSESPCAVDVESLDRNFERIESHYMSGEEKCLADIEEWPCIVWCAKETMYKYQRHEGCSLLNDLKIESVDIPGRSLSGDIQGRKVKLGWMRLDNQILVFLL